MKHFKEVIEQLTAMHKDVNTTYAPTKMFSSANDLSFAISRLLDAEEILVSETLDHKEITPDLRTQWFAIRESMPKETAQNIAICIINNTPLSKTSEEIDAVKQLFNNLLNDFTKNEQLSTAFTEIFFSNETTQSINKRQFKKPKRD